MEARYFVYLFGAIALILSIVIFVLMKTRVLGSAWMMLDIVLALCALATGVLLVVQYVKKHD